MGFSVLIVICHSWCGILSISAIIDGYALKFEYIMLLLVNGHNSQFFILLYVNGQFYQLELSHRHRIFRP